LLEAADQFVGAVEALVEDPDRAQAVHPEVGGQVEHLLAGQAEPADEARGRTGGQRHWHEADTAVEMGKRDAALLRHGAHLACGKAAFRISQRDVRRHRERVEAARDRRVELLLVRMGPHAGFPENPFDAHLLLLGTSGPPAR
jgi:hypothetical protein